MTRTINSGAESLYKCCVKGERLAVASRPLCEVALQVRKSMRLILQLWCLVQVISLISAAPRQEGNLRGTEGNGIINFRCEVKEPLGASTWQFWPVFFCRSTPNAAQALPILRIAILSNRNPGVPHDGSVELARPPVVRVLDAFLGGP